jgi:hypothetical protein
MLPEHNSSAGFSHTDKLFGLWDRNIISQFGQRRLQQTFNLFIVPFPNAYFKSTTFNVVSSVHRLTLRTSLCGNSARRNFKDISRVASDSTTYRKSIMNIKHCIRNSTPFLISLYQRYTRKPSCSTRCVHNTHTSTIHIYKLPPSNSINQTAQFIRNQHTI